MTTLQGIRERGQVRWGIVGCGDVTEVKSGPAFRRLPGNSLSVVMRRDGRKARDYAERHGVPRWTADAAEVIEAGDVDAVYVATPPASHAEYVLRAAASGKPVYVEKPMATSLAEAEAMVQACEQAGVPLFVAYYRRALPRFELVRTLLQEGRIGEPLLLQADLQQPAPADAAQAGWRWDPAVGGDGLLLDLGSHGLDLFDHWLGPIQAVHGFADSRLPRSQVADEVVGAFRFSGGAHGTAAWSFGGASQRDAIRVSGTLGSVEVPLFAEGPVRLLDASGRETERHLPHPAHVQEPLIATIVGELLGHGPPCPSTGLSALRTQAVLDALLQRSPSASG